VAMSNLCLKEKGGGTEGGGPPGGVFNQNYPSQKRGGKGEGKRGRRLKRIFLIRIQRPPATTFQKIGKKKA